ncbi:MAG: serine hydrolase [Chloroflexi bacterium]|nr:serine hydrolase [Chloroflexota bacterium]
MTALEQGRVRLAAMLAGLDGEMGLAARDLATGAEIMLRADLVCPTASTFKIALLYELLRQVDAGRLDLATRIAPTRAEQLVPGSGVMQDLDPGCAFTLRDLATMMIVLSDNAATDMLYHRLGRDAIAAVLGDLGLSQTSLPLTTREILYSLVGLDPADPAATYDLARERLRWRQIGADPLALQPVPANDVSTPRDMLTLMQAIVDGRGLSAAARAMALDIMRRQKYTDRIPLRLPAGTRVANKTGSIFGVRGDVGYVEAPDHPFVLAILSRNLVDELAATRLMADLALTVYETFTAPAI